MIQRVCDSSAGFCARLERDAIEQKHKKPRAAAGKLPVENSDNALRSVESKPGGRPRKDDERESVRTLKAEGLSWKDIASKVNAQTGQNKSHEAYRALLRSRSWAEKNGQK